MYVCMYVCMDAHTHTHRQQDRTWKPHTPGYSVIKLWLELKGENGNAGFLFRDLILSYQSKETIIVTINPYCGSLN